MLIDVSYYSPLYCFDVSNTNFKIKVELFEQFSALPVA